MLGRTPRKAASDRECVLTASPLNRPKTLPLLTAAQWIVANM